MPSFFISIFAAIFGLQILFFLIANSFKTDKLTDLAYGLTFVILVQYLFWTTNQSFYFLLPTILISLWGLRLASYLLIRILKIKKDKRFDNIRPNFISFLGFWLLQATTIFAVSLNYVFLSQSNNQTINLISVLAFILAAIGLGIETMADYQKYQFKNDPKNKGQFIQTGLWKHSRHPNYLGEIIFWLAIWLYSLSALNAATSLISLISPIYIFLLIRFVSGVPLLEKNYAKRYGQAWEKYKAKTRVI